MFLQITVTVCLLHYWLRSYTRLTKPSQSFCSIPCVIDSLSLSGFCRQPQSHPTHTRTLPERGVDSHWPLISPLCRGLRLQCKTAENTLQTHSTRSSHSHSGTMSGEDAPAQQQNAVDQKQETKPAEEPKSEPAKTEAAEAAATPAAAPEKAPEEEAFTYRALVLTGYGGYDKVKLQVKKGKPALKAGEVQVRVKTCGLNFADLMARQGLYDRLPSPPVTPGMECAGVVEAVGEEVTDRKVGDKVMVLNRFGLWQEVVVASVNHTFLIPDGMSFEEAAALPVNYITAYMMLFDFGHLRPNQSVLIHSAAGGVGTAATQLCKTVNDVTVFGTASASKHEALTEAESRTPSTTAPRTMWRRSAKSAPKFSADSSGMGYRLEFQRQDFRLVHIVIVAEEPNYKRWILEAVEIRRQGARTTNRDEGAFSLAHMRLTPLEITSQGRHTQCDRSVKLATRISCKRHVTAPDVTSDACCRNCCDIVLDPLGGSDTQKGYNLLKPMGKLITYAPRSTGSVPDSASDQTRVEMTALRLREREKVEDLDSLFVSVGSAVDRLLLRRQSQRSTLATVGSAGIHQNRASAFSSRTPSPCPPSGLPPSAVSRDLLSSSRTPLQLITTRLSSGHPVRPGVLFYPQLRRTQSACREMNVTETPWIADRVLTTG
ncbi:hypothetical protein WMY93_003414 [Mugilogobius chulae]|uniref:Enoyl reductase (ER) domain-containing protein n=1 Tax=Mugilogobius chulae TaxID=88201 RepID=A0AAW0PWL9_9GOBI